MFSLLSFLALIIAITIHEFSHALIADRLGDPTPRANDRLSLNPLKHLDPLGTLMLFVARFGWGKPVPIDPFNFAHPRRDELLVSLAGPASNLLLALTFSFLTRPFPILSILIIVNISLAVFNLLPIPPLDGSKIFLNLLPPEKSIEWQKAFDRYGFFLLALLLILPFGSSNLISLLISPPINFLLDILLP